MGNKRKDEELADRLLDFAVRIIKLVKRLPNNKIRYPRKRPITSMWNFTGGKL